MPAEASADDTPAAPPSEGRFAVVGLGASAGGLEALRQFYASLPADTGMGFVVIQHLDPERPSMLTKVLEGVTALEVVEATNGMRVAPNRVHVIPSGADLSIRNGVLELVPWQRTGRLHLPIDSFFRSLAEDCQGRAIGVVFSGSGADGTEGLRAIKAAGGICLAQDPESAQFRSMPESAIAAKVVDTTGSPDTIAGEIARLGRHPYVAAPSPVEPEAKPLAPDEDGGLARILASVHQYAGLDFSGYKRTTVQRRIERRMALRHLSTLDEYAQSLQDDAGEAKALAQDMLIHVTSFFRDPDAFEALKKHVFQALVQRKTGSDSIRIWVPGCSTGEEAYAVTICLLEVLEGRPNTPIIKVFGSDLSDEAIEVARLGKYSEAAVADLAPERLSRFFERVEGGYRIGKRVRDLVVFVKHDLTRDPPFAKLDLLSCRNLLIYFDTELQRRIIPMLHYCLSKHGYLFLGKSESITGFREFFAPVDKERRIFVKIGESTRLMYPLPAGREAEVKMSAAVPAERRQPAREAQAQADHVLLARYAPPGVIVNERLDVIQFRGRTGEYLEPPPGQPQANVLRMAKEGLAAHLHDAIEQAKEKSTSIRKDGLRIRDGDETRYVSLEVIPLTALPDAADRYYLIVFEETPPVSKGERVSQRPSDVGQFEDSAEAERLKAELVATKDYLQSVVAEHQSSTDDLAAANEELVAANEELQSTNEELQSAKEELQSTNEELGTVNDQLRSRNQELDELANDMVNVLASVEIPVVIVDLELRVRRFTPTVNQVARFIPEDVGRPIDDLKLELDVEDLPARIQSVIDGLAPREWEVQDHDGRWFRMQIRPYRTKDNRLDGAVLAFVDVDALKHALDDAEGARDFARSIVETVTSALVVLDQNLRVVTANQAFQELFRLGTKDAEGKSLLEVGAGLFEKPVVRRALDDAVTERVRFTGVELTAELPGRPRMTILSLTGRPILWTAGAPMVLLAIDDVTTLRELEAERVQLLASEREARIEAETANRAKDLFLATLSHELRTPLSTMLMSAEILQHTASEDARVARASASIERSAKAQARLIDDLLDVSRIVSGKLFLDLGPVDLAAIVHEAVDIARPSAQSKGLDLSVSIEGQIGNVYGDAARLLQVVNNLLTNAIKFTLHGGRISVRLERVEGRARLTVADNGIGIRPEVIPHLFSRFVQADSTVTRTHGGLGLGLSIVRHLVEVHRGDVRAESPGEGKGSTFTVTLPLGAAPKTNASASPRSTTRDINGVRVLLVDDDEDTRDAYATTLSEFGADVRAVSSAAEALEVLDEHHPQVILSDIAMPGEDGFSFIQKVRSRDVDHGGQIPAAALTALASDEDKQRAMQSGFQLHVAKPLDAARLIAVVSMLVDWAPLGTATEARL